MARFTALTAFDMNTFLLNANLDDFFQSATGSGNSTRYVFTDTYDGITEQLVLNGTFGNFVDGIPTTGTITSAGYSITGGESFSFGGISMSVEEFTGYVQAGDSAGLFAALLAGNDTITGSTGNDTLLGFAGNDTINGRTGADIAAGMTGDDTYRFDNTGDHAVEFAGEGTDTVISMVDFALDDHVEVLRLGGSAFMGGGNDLDNSVFGTNSENQLYGFQGNDSLHGRGGRDTLIGGGGSDVIDGGLGRDTLTGNAGADEFVFRNGETASGRFSADIITDFSQADGDEIQLNIIDANTNLDGNQRFTWVSDGAFTGVAGQLRYAQANGMTYVEGDTNGDSIADVVLTLNGTIDLTALDFVL